MEYVHAGSDEEDRRENGSFGSEWTDGRRPARRSGYGTDGYNAESKPVLRSETEKQQPEVIRSETAPNQEEIPLDGLQAPEENIDLNNDEEGQPSAH